MSRRVLGVAVGLVFGALATVATTAGTQTSPQDLRGAVTAWLDEQYLNKYPETTARIRRMVADDLALGYDFVLTFGPGVMKSGNAQRLVVFGGEMHVLELSIDQARKALAGPDRVSYARGQKDRANRDANARVRVLAAQIDGSGGLEPTAEIAGKLSCEGAGAGNAVRLTYHYDGTTSSQFYHLAAAPLKPKETIAFTAGPLRGKNSPKGPPAGPLVVLLDLCTVTEEADPLRGGAKVPKVRVVSNSVAVLVEVIAPVAGDPVRDMRFVRVPKGTFWTGGGTAFDGAAMKRVLRAPTRQVTIAADFEMGAYPVTQAQWQAVMGSNPSGHTRQGTEKDAVEGVSDEELRQFPVENVSWEDVQVFLTRLNAREKGKGWTYRLPTEAEWEYACRGAPQSKEECSYDFYFAKPTNELSPTQANFVGSNLGRPTKVGSYAPNRLGLYDMHGNVWQWCADRFDPAGKDRVIRGGYFRMDAEQCRAASRVGIPPSQGGSGVGFRLVRVPSGG